MSFRPSSRSVGTRSTNLLGARCLPRNLGADGQLTPCTVDLYTRPVFQEDGSAHPVAKHWLLHFKWSDCEVTLDANAVEGRLLPQAVQGGPEPLERGAYEVMRLAENLSVSPKKVLELAKRNKNTGRPYHALLCNCQQWVLELGRLLGIELPDDQVTEWADIGLTGFAVAGVGSLAVQSISQTKRY
ncbi:uncharacterized protein [Macrobrachium rosenbergii]|uniref:uncharacterized protein n=1 Tax=Macrobrachium rosenbergii TaxID=79674 RepID=UPI0034D64619